MVEFDVEAWRSAARDAVKVLLAGFEQQFGYPPDDHVVGGPSGDDVLSTAQRAGTVPEELLEFYRQVSAVELPDVHIGFFIHRLSQVLDNERNGTPVSAPTLTDSGIVVFGSDGGGALFALEVSGSPVYLLPTGAVRDGVYVGGLESPRIVAEDLPEFLDWLLAAVQGFAKGDLAAGVYPS
jgi:hypothetical protein